MIPHNFDSWFFDLRERLFQRQHRCLLVLHGKLSWGNLLVQRLIVATEQADKALSSDNIIAYGDGFTGEQRLLVSNYRHHLGTENQLVVFADSDFHPDAFAALSGTLVAGGLMVWLCPPELVADKNDLFMQRMWQQVLDDKYSLVLHQKNRLLATIPALDAELDNTKPFVCPYDACVTAEQFDAVQAVEKVMHGHRRRPLVLTADRGRGKSSALAIAVANIIKSAASHAQLNIVISAPHQHAVKVFLEQLKNSCPQGQYHELSFCYQSHKVRFIAVDVIISQQPPSHLMLVDEAAAIPVYVLSRLLDMYPRMVFASTIHGYEGAGRGFTVKFSKELTNKAPQYNALHIRQPIRWQENDPLEQFVFKGFLLANSSDEQPLLSPDDNKFALINRQISAQQLFKDERLLQQVFSVLITAHYQTKPSDLKLLLTNTSFTIFATFVEQQVVAVALAVKEGLADNHQVALVEQSKKRLKDQFLPQSLLLYGHNQQAFALSYLRIMRIAVVENFQHYGIGQQLLAFVKQYAQQQKIDALGTSFGATAQLLRFWTRCNYRLLRLGFSRDKASGEHSALLLQALSTEAQSVQSQATKQFYRQLSFLLDEQFKMLAGDLVCSLIKQWPESQLPELTQFDQQVVDNFVNKHSVFASCAFSLQIWLVHQIYYRITPEQAPELLIRRILQKQSVSDINQALGFTGKKQLNNALLQQVKALASN